ncbi:exodeoxyribonuclease VII large subunit [Thermoleophilia bacterium SCSIO 60948]|nr:exodeoxyribonuclease VII large subunit [Thermoleophilia bacterium SCSIO 60948]
MSGDSPLFGPEEVGFAPTGGAGAEEADPELSPDPDLPGPYPVGRWSMGFRDFLRQRPRILLIGELTGFKRARANAYFELRDTMGAVPCSIWNSDLDKLDLDPAALGEGVKVVVGGGPDFYPGGPHASPSFSFRATHMRLAGEGDLLAQLARLRRTLESEGLFEPQKLLGRPRLPKRIGVVTARNSAACADLLAGLERRGWRGTIVWADAPVQDRRASRAIGSALRGLAASDVEVAVVCRGGGSLADLWAFCDESLCRTVALLRLPVVAAVGHESDRTLIDDVAAVSCSTPTHAAEALVPLDVAAERTRVARDARLAARAGRHAILTRGRRLGELAGAPQRTLRAERSRLHQLLREVRASAGRGVIRRGSLAATHALVVSRKGTQAAGATVERARLRGLEQAVRAHDPQRTLERGYARVESAQGEPVTSAAAARRAGRFDVRFADDAVGVRADETEES